MKNVKVLNSLIEKTSFVFAFLLILASGSSIFSQDNSSNFQPIGYHLYDLNNNGTDDLWMFNDGNWRIYTDTVPPTTRTFTFGTINDVPVPEFYLPITTSSIARPTVWRSSDATWYSDTFTTQFGLSGDKPVPWDYDGDSKTDLAIFRGGDWWILKSSDGGAMVIQWGLPGDIPVPGYFFDTDNKGDFTIFRPTELKWYALNSFNGSTKIRLFGAVGDKLVPADYDGDFLTDFAVFRANGALGEWWVLKSSNDTSISGQFGLATDLTAQADYDGDGKADFAVYRESEFKWFILKSFCNCVIERIFGEVGEKPVANYLFR